MESCDAFFNLLPCYCWRVQFLTPSFRIVNVCPGMLPADDLADGAGYLDCLPYKVRELCDVGFKVAIS